MTNYIVLKTYGPGIEPTYVGSYETLLDFLRHNFETQTTETDDSWTLSVRSKDYKIYVDGDKFKYSVEYSKSTPKHHNPNGFTKEEAWKDYSLSRMFREVIHAFGFVVKRIDNRCN